MNITRITSITELRKSALAAPFNEFLHRAEQDHFFQSPEFLEFIDPVAGYRPVLFIAQDDKGQVRGSLLGCYQSDGSRLKSWLSRRLIVWGGPLGDANAADHLLGTLLKDASGKAIYVEFRNYFDTGHLHGAFEHHGFAYNPHLNFLVSLGPVEEVQKRLSGTRRREIKSSLAAGVEFGEADNEQEVQELYRLLAELYRDKVGKPLPHLSLFLRFFDSPSGKVFVVRYEGRIIGGSAGPVYKGEAIYHWYVCGDNSIKGIHASVMATWAQIEHGASNGFKMFDFMGAGRPGQGYGVHDFKSRFGGEEVAYGRYEKILNVPLYRLGMYGLKFLHMVTGKQPKKN